jgi:hypothetical protein
LAIKKETELYMPVKTYFENQGYEVKSEVKGCDLVAVQSGERNYTIVELKKTFNLQLIFQAIERLKLSDSVYVAVEYHPRKRLSSYFSWKDAAHLCARLGIGLIGIQFYKTKKPAVDILCHPGLDLVKGTSTKRSQRVRTEFERRTGDYNIGGSTRRKLVTAYREKALRCAALLSQQECMTLRELRELLRDPSIALMLQKNYYGWFERIAKGKYSLTTEGKKALAEYAHIIRPAILTAADEHLD